jgi:hypothetical protein
MVFPDAVTLILLWTLGLITLSKLFHFNTDFGAWTPSHLMFGYTVSDIQLTPLLTGEWTPFPKVLICALLVH